MYAYAACTARVSFGSNLEFEAKILFCVLIADVSDEFFGPLGSIRNASSLYIVTDEVAEDATEVFVTRVGKERARIGDHSDESTEQTEVGKGVHLIAHTTFLIEEPPTRAVLNLSRSNAVLE